jgi:murein DD-endopeptidase MepM/ murein hydrolase activator NlpD
MVKFDLKSSLSAIFILLFLGILVWALSHQKSNLELQKTNKSPQGSVSKEIQPSVQKPGLTAPIDRALERITKKPFGLKVTPQDSPVRPERFSGFHTGVDFETFPEEQEAEVAVYAICDGPLLQRRFVSGYGGVVIQSCILESRDITVVYGHLKLGSIGLKIGDRVLAGDRLGILGKGFSPETDGERKHLHLGIHLGKEPSLAGYVQKESGLKNWLDAAKYLK